jgi:MscS family membrane protein
MIKYLLIFLFSTTLIFSKGFNTPREVAINHFSYLQQDNYKPRISAKSFLELKGYDNKKLAIRLKKFLDSKGILVEIDKIPDNPNHFDSLQEAPIFIPIKEYSDIYFKKVDGRWFYSEETSKNVSKYYKQIFPTGLEEILSSLPEVFFMEFLTIELWQWLGLLIFLIISFLIFVVLHNLILVYFHKFLERTKKGEKLRFFIGRVAKPTSLYFILLFAQFFFPYLQLRLEFAEIFNILTKVLEPIVITIIAYRLTDLLSDVFSKYAEKTESTVDDQLVPLFRKTLKIVVVVIGSIYIVKNLGVDATPLLAGASVGGLAFALAAQDILKNFFGSFTIFTDKPFDVGDWIVFGDTQGTVEEVGVRTTRVRTFYNSLVSVPNGKISDMVVDNMGRRVYRRYTTKLQIKYNTDPEKIKLFVAGLEEEFLKLERARKDYYEIFLNDFGTYSLQVLIYVFFKVDNWTQELEQQQEFIFRTLDLAKKLGIEFAYPTQSLDLLQNNHKDLNE